MLRLTKGQRVLVAGILITIGYFLKKLIGYELVTIIVMLGVTAISGFPIFKKSFQALKYKIVGIDALVTIAVIGALFIGEYWEAAAVTYLFMLGDYLESRTIEKTRSSLKALLNLAPDVARVKRDKVEMEINSEEVILGDIVIVKQGEKIPVDGIIIEGNAYINQAAITGESFPVNRGVNERTFSGTIIESGYLIIRAEKVGEDTTFARILQLVEEAQDKKANTQKFFERFSRYYTPCIIVISIILFIFTRDIVLSLTLLVIACPGALVISTPVSIVAGIGNGAKHGVLIKGGDIMEKLGTIKVMAFDKTGTLTIGKPTVTHIETFNISEDELLRLATIGESYSEHPLGKAIVNKGVERLGQVYEKPTDVKIITGQGIEFNLNGKSYVIGNRRLFDTNKINIDDIETYLASEEDKGQTAVIVGDVEKVLGVISIADIVRTDAKDLIKNLKSFGIQRIVMLTGDNMRSAKAIVDELGLDDYYAELLPEDKVKILNKLEHEYGTVGMVGDGVNDAPALATADLGIAIGGAASDVAMETADVVLMSAEIKKLSHAIGLSRATVNNMKQNIYFALLVAALLLAGVLVKTVNLSFGMLVHEVSVLLVIINAVRLLAYGEKEKL